MAILFDRLILRQLNGLSGVCIALVFFMNTCGMSFVCAYCTHIEYCSCFLFLFGVMKLTDITTWGMTSTLEDSMTLPIPHVIASSITYHK